MAMNRTAADTEADDVRLDGALRCAEPPSGHGKRRASGSAVPPKKRRCTLQDALDLKAATRDVKGRSTLTFPAATLIAHAYAMLSIERLEPASPRERPCPHLTEPAQKSTAAVLGVSTRTVSKAVRWVREAAATEAGSRDRVAVTGRTGARGRGSKRTRVPDTPQVGVKVRQFVRKMRGEHRRVTGRQVMEFLVDEGHLEVPRAVPVSGAGASADRKALAAAQRATNRWLARRGYSRGQRGGSVAVKDEHAAWLAEYYDTIMSNRAKPPHEQLREVYTDESFVHHHYQRGEHSVHDPNDALDRGYSRPRKGRRLCICHAIQGPDPRVRSDRRRFGRGELAGPVRGDGVLWVFCPNRKDPRSRDHEGDYHKAFNASNYMHWFDKLLAALKQPSLIILDNAKYHLARERPDVRRMTKAECQQFLRDRGEEIAASGPSSHVPSLKRRIREWISANVPLEVVRRAEAAGHAVARTPPRLSSVQPIELFWAQVKGEVGRAYHRGTTLDMVEQRLVAAFKAADEDDGRHRPDGQTRVQAMIDAATRELVGLKKRADDAAPEALLQRQQREYEARVLAGELE